jgi:gluconolactonase
MSAIDVADERLLELVDPQAEVEQLGGGFRFTEGPVWVPDGDYLLFSDVLANRRHRWDERDGVRTVADPSNIGNGMTLDREGRLVVCEGGGRAVVCMDPSGTGAGREVVVESYRGRRLNSPNDVVVRSDGSIWFTDSWYLTRLGLEAEQELDFQGVFRVAAGGAGPELVLGDMDFPNGLTFSPDETILYVNDSTPGHIRALDVDAGGAVSNDRVFATVPKDATGHVDGMKCDERGNVWVTGPGGVWVLDDTGRHLGTIRLPERTGNLHWGGTDLRWLFIASSSGIYRLRTKIAGRREPFMHAVGR